MIRGINRQVIEITDTGNIYYERALLVVRPEYRGAQKALLEREAKKMLKQIHGPSILKKKQLIFYWLIRLGAAAVVGGLVTCIIFNIILT